MSTGRLVAQGTLESLQSALTRRIRVESSAPAETARVLTDLKLPGVSSNGASVSADLGDEPSEPIIESLVKAGVPVSQVVIERPGLEELFVSLTGEGFDVDE
jgi:ABC-2 type transport system ATP-binding protein